MVVPGIELGLQPPVGADVELLVTDVYIELLVTAVGAAHKEIYSNPTMQL